MSERKPRVCECGAEFEPMKDYQWEQVVKPRHEESIAHALRLEDEWHPEDAEEALEGG